VYSVSTLRSHYSRYLQIFLAQNIITNTKCSEKYQYFSFNPTHSTHHMCWKMRPNPTQPMDGPNPCPSLVCLSHSLLRVCYLGPENADRQALSTERLRRSCQLSTADTCFKSRGDYTRRILILVYAQLHQLSLLYHCCCSRSLIYRC